MNTSNKFLNALFNNLSSVYPSNDGMINSNLFVLFNSYAQVFTNIDNISLDTLNDTYLDLSNVNVLEQNFSPYVDFPKPPRLNTVTNGGEIYRAILRSIYDAFLNGSTEDSMDVGLSTVLSYLTIDENSDLIISESNSVLFNTYDRSIMLAYPATSSSGTIAQPSDIIISPSGLTVYDYDNSTQTIRFSGTIPISGQAYVIDYFRDHSYQINTDWINFTNTSGTSPLPTDLKTIENTYRNPKFSYWWNTYNRDGNGVQIIDGTLEPSEVGLVWRLPEKYFSYTDPFTNNTTKATTTLYNLSGSVYDINSPNKAVNPDYEQTSKVRSYVDEVSRSPEDYYIRYSQNNSVFPALAQFSGSMNQVEKVSDISVDFGSTNFGILDFFQKGNNFDINDLFGFGTKNIWTNVANKNDIYSLSTENFFERPYSLHEKIIFDEFFENGWRSLGRFVATTGNTKLAEVVGVPLEDSEDCLQLFGGSASVYPLVSTSEISQVNRINVDMFDQNNVSGTTSNITVGLINTQYPDASRTTTFRFGIIETGGAVEIYGINGFIFDDTVPSYHFVNTYFENIDQTEYCITSSASYSLVAGGINPSTMYHLEPSASAVVTPNLDSLQDADRVEFSISSDNNFTISFQSATQGVPSLGGYYDNNTQSLTWNAASKSFGGASLYATSHYFPSPPGYVLTGGGGGGIIYAYGAVIPPAVFNIVIEKGGTTVNGTVITSSSFFRNNIGIPSTVGVGFVFNSPQAIKLTLSSGAKLYHYFVGSSSLYNRYFLGQKASGYFYQIAPSGTDINTVSKNVLSFSNQTGWHRVSIDLGSGLNYLTAKLDDYQFFDYDITYSGNIGFIGSYNDSKAITLNHETENPTYESSYFDNLKLSYYNPEVVNSIYDYNEDITQDWQGSYLDQSAVISNRTFKGTRQANFTFELIIKGLQNKFLYIIQGLVYKLKPAHTLVDLNVQTDHVLNTTNMVAQYVDDERNWETGNLLNSVYVTPDVDTADILDLPGLITISPSWA